MQGIELAPVVIASMIVGYMLNDFIRYVKSGNEVDVYISKEMFEKLAEIIEEEKKKND